MKEFEKQWEEGMGGVCGKIGCEAFWRAALLWFWKTAEHLSPSDCDLIDEELGNETS